MRYAHLSAAVILLGALAGRAAYAQELAARSIDALEPGTRVRVLVPEQERQANNQHVGHALRGTLVRLTSDTLYLAVTDSLGPLAIPRRLVQRLDQSRGVPSAAASALRRGLATGVGGAVAGLLVAASDTPQHPRDDAEWALIGGAAGFALGATWGALFPIERWRRVQLAPVLTAGRVNGAQITWRGRI